MPERFGWSNEIAASTITCALVNTDNLPSEEACNGDSDSLDVAGTVEINPATDEVTFILDDDRLISSYYVSGPPPCCIAPCAL